MKDETGKAKSGWLSGLCTVFSRIGGRGHKVESEEAPQLTTFESDLDTNFKEYYRQGYMALLVILKRDPQKQGLMFHKDADTGESVPCVHDYIPIGVNEDPYAKIHQCREDKTPVVMAFDMKHHHSLRDQMPEGWKPGTIYAPTSFSGSPHISLAPHHDYVSGRELIVSIDAETDSFVFESIPKPRAERPRGHLRVASSNEKQEPKP